MPCRVSREIVMVVDCEQIVAKTQLLYYQFKGET